MKKLLIFGGILLVILSLLFMGCITPPSGNSTITNITFRIGAGSNPILGNPGARITIVEFTDYQCPFCARHATQVFPEIESSYVKTGKVKYYLRDFPLPIHSNSNSAAIAARCAGEQGKYWEMHTLLFQNQDEWKGLSGSQPDSRFAEYASSLGLNDAQFSACYSSGKFSSQISADKSDASMYGISGTPSSLIILPKTANETKLLAILSSNPSYVQQGYLSLSRDPDGNYVFFIKGAFPYEIFQKALDS